MKCCSRSTLGVVIGGINMLFYAGCAIIIIGLIYNNETIRYKTPSYDQMYISNEYNTDTTVIVKENTVLRVSILSNIMSACLVMSIISGLLVVGIIKRRHKLMWPWLAVSGIAFICSCFNVLFSVIVGIPSGLIIKELLVMLVAGSLGAGIQALILWPVYTLCRDIMQKNKQKPGQFMDDVQYSYVAPDAPPQYNYSVSGLPQKS